MKKSCRTLIYVKKHKKYLLGHVTNSNHYDIPKGGMDAGETPLETAIRECYEEFGLTLNAKKMEYLYLMLQASVKDDTARQ